VECNYDRDIHWAAAKLIARLAHEKEVAKIMAACRKLAKITGKHMAIELWLWAVAYPTPKPTPDSCSEEHGSQCLYHTLLCTHHVLKMAVAAYLLSSLTWRNPAGSTQHNQD
jgi:hypothetical protein